MGRRSERHLQSVYDGSRLERRSRAVSYGTAQQRELRGRASFVRAGLLRARLPGVIVLVVGCNGGLIDRVRNRTGGRVTARARWLTESAEFLKSDG